MKNKLQCLCYTVMMVLLFSSLHAQVQVENKDIKDVFKGNKGGATDSVPEIVVDKNYISLLPVVGYAPANGFLIGAAISFSRLFDPRPTNLSSGMLNFQITSKQQFIVNARSKIYLDNNKWFLQGDWRILFFAQPTYGLGITESSGSNVLFTINGSNNTNDASKNQVQDMRFNYVRAYEDVVRNIGKSWFIGLGYSLDYHYSIKDQTLVKDTAAPDFHLTDHYIYSVANGFKPDEYVTSGVNLNVLRDTRDNIANAYKGYLASVTIRVNPTFLGSSKNSTMLNYDARYFLPFSKKYPRHLLAFWSWGSFVTSGDVPYLALPSIGWDTYNRSGRGYIQGRYRGLSMLYMEAEYRFPITSDGLLGGVAFVNNTFAKSETQDLFAKSAPGVGAGIRVKMDKAARINLTVDAGYGKNNSSGIYFNLQEAF